MDAGSWTPVEARSTIRALAVDFDGTLTEGGCPLPPVLEALARFRAGGGRVVLATGRILAELDDVFPAADDHVDAIVAENGAVLRVHGHTRLLCDPVPEELDRELHHAGRHVRRGQVLLAGRHGDAHEAAAALHRLGLDCQLVANRGELMVLPAGVTKGGGVRAALAELGISPHNTVAVGDAENDHSMLEACELGVAVAGAIEGLQRHADLVTAGHAGLGVCEVLRLVATEPQLGRSPARWEVPLGTAPDGTAVGVAVAHVNVLVTGRSGAGKSHVAGLLAEGAVRAGYTIVVLDPEGDHTALGTLPSVVVVGGGERLPTLDHIVSLLRRSLSVVVDLSGRPRAERAAFLDAAPAVLEALWTACGVPQWTLIDEAHGLLGHDGPARRSIIGRRPGQCLVTYRPDALCPEVRDTIDLTIDVPGTDGAGDRGVREVRLVQHRRGGLIEDGVTPRPRETAHARHWHKYLSDRLPEHQRFWFRDERDHLSGEPAGNLAELHRELRRCGAGVLRHHARGHDISRWLRHVFRADELAAAVAEVEDAIDEAGRPGDVEILRARLVAVIEEHALRR